MNYPKNIEDKLEFNVIKDKLASLCCGTLGKKLVEQIRFTNAEERIRRMHEQTSELSSLLEKGITFPEKYFNDDAPLLQQAEIEGSVLTEEQLAQIKNSLHTIHQCQQIIDQLDDVSYPRMKELAAEVQLTSHVWYKLDAVLDENGRLKDTASAKLNLLRKQIIDMQTQLRRRLDAILRKAKADGHSHDDANITIRNGRLVIPVLAEAKRKIKGFIHDESATGQTVFMEPAEVLETNNQIRELIFEEMREVGRILYELTELLRPHLKDMRRAYTFLAQIDFIRAKARLARLLQATFPGHSAQPMIRLSQARHPVLFLLHEAQHLKTVPLNMILDEGTRIVVISGPNAGGKSIALKTVGLLQYMYQCGLPVSVGLGTEMGIFEQILVDIGDEQSIENDLSTYSSHLAAMRLFMQKAHAKTLFLIDEFGAGTEPQYGGAMAEAILEQLNHKKAFGVVTTHYANLKAFAGRTKGVINAAMRYDIQKLEPLFELELGQPGSSFALEIAQKMGIPKAVIDNARKKIGIKQVNFDKLLAQFEIEKKEYQTKSAEVKALEAHLKRLVMEYDKLKKQLESQKKSLIDAARAEAKQLLAKANKEIENTIRTIKESKAEKSATRQARMQLEQFAQRELQPETSVPETQNITIAIETTDTISDEPENLLPGEVLKVGDYVSIDNMQSVGVVAGYNGKDYEVRMGELKLYLKPEKVKKISKRAYEQHLKNEEKYTPSFTGIDLTDKLMNFDNQLDIRGYRADEAIKALENTIDEALLLGQKEIRILHGKGSGVLRNLVREQLKKYRQVKNVRDDHPDRGGAGVTIVSLE